MSTRIRTISESSDLPRFVKYPKIPYAEDFPKIFGQEGYVFEKVDGGLSQVRNTDAGLFGGSKANFLVGDITKAAWFPKFLRWMRSNYTLNNLPTDVIMFGEWAKGGRLSYDKDRLNRFYFIDLGFVNENKVHIFDYEESLNYLRSWGIEGVDILHPLKKAVFDEADLKEFVLSARSQLGGERIEGVVMKNYKNQQFAKYLHPKYSEIREEEKTLEKKFINTPRVRKALIRLKEESGIDKPSLEDLALEIVRDIEEESEISFSTEAVMEVLGFKHYYHPPKK